MYRILKTLVSRLYAPLLLYYLKKDRWYSHSGVKLFVKRGVFHPGFFFSTRFLLAHVRQQILLDKKLLELGAGSGLISFYAAKRGAKVMATDVSNLAIEGLNMNSKQLNLPVQVVHSNLFQAIPVQTFDYIIINPPYYPQTPHNEQEMAWFCGKEFEYFKELFAGLAKYMQRNTCVLMSLSQDCNLERITGIANANGFDFILLRKKRIMWELNYIYQIIKKHE